MKLLGALRLPGLSTGSAVHIAVYGSEPSDNDDEHGAMLLKTGSSSMQPVMTADEARHISILLVELADQLDAACCRDPVIAAVLAEPGVPLQ